jgi:hypothetical protein
MNARAQYRWITVTIVALALLAVTGCAKQDGPYNEAKQGWDSPRSMVQLHDLRTRLATTQQDH